MSEFKVGAKVRVEFDAVIEEALRNAYDESGRHGIAVQKVRDSEGCFHFVYLYPEIADVIEADPENWPPQLGDIWEADGTEFVVMEAYGGGPVIAEVTGFRSFFVEEAGEFKALSPVLVRRRYRGNVHLSFNFRTDPQSVAEEVLKSVAHSKLT